MPMQRTDSLKQELSRFSARIVHRGLAVGPGGNTSVRDGDAMWISPSGLALDEISEPQWVELGIETGERRSPGLRPSSEYAMHRGIYRNRPDVGAIVHTHPMVTIAVISAGYDQIPVMFPDQIAIGGTLACIDYILPCTTQLADAVSSKIEDPQLSGLLLRNHGLITVGQTVREAYYRTEIVEEAAKAFWIARSIGPVRSLTEEECQAILGLEAEQYRQSLLRTSNGDGQ